MLGISQILHGPLLILIHLVFFGILCICNLSFSSGHNVSFLILTETLKVVWNVPMWSQLRLCGIEIFSHDVAHVRSLNLTLILILLIIFPVWFSVFFILGQLLIVFLKLLHHLLLSCSRIVLEHSSHSGDRIDLLSVVWRLLVFVLWVLLMLLHLILEILFLESSLISHSSVVCCKKKS